MKRRSPRALGPSLFRTPPIFPRELAARGSKLDAVFAALSDPTRRAMVQRLSQGQVSVGELAKPFQISLPAVSRHLHVLENAGLIARKRDGRVHLLRLDPTPLKSTAEWIDDYRPLWETQLDALSRHLEKLGEERKLP